MYDCYDYGSVLSTIINKLCYYYRWNVIESCIWNKSFFCDNKFYEFVLLHGIKTVVVMAIKTWVPSLGGWHIAFCSWSSLITDTYICIGNLSYRLATIFIGFPPGCELLINIMYAWHHHFMCTLRTESVYQWEHSYINRVSCTINVQPIFPAFFEFYL